MQTATISIESEINNEFISLKETKESIFQLEQKIKELETAKKVFVELEESKKVNIENLLKESGKDDLKTGMCHVFYKTTQSLQVQDISLIPEGFTRVKIEPDKIALKKALEQGQSFEGVSLVENKSLQIRG